MNALTYQDAAFPVRDDLTDAHKRFWARLQMPGAWLTSAQKIDIAREVRAAPDCPLCREMREALSPNAVSGKHRVVTNLKAPIIEMVHRIVNDASRLTASWYRNLIDATDFSDGEYVEVVGTVVAMVSIDAFADGIGAARRELPPPGSGQPTRYRPATAETTDQAWVPMVPVVNEGTPEEDLWVSGRSGNVIRAMSLVPDEVRSLNELSAAHYMPNRMVSKAGVDPGRSLTRSQMELVAGRVSALNQCFY